MKLPSVLQPYMEESGNAWMKRAGTWFFAALIPLVALLCLALWRRVSAFGITEPRYLAIISAVWLAGIAICFLFAKHTTIKAVPVTLFVVALFSAGGPWSALRVSEASQIKVRARNITISAARTGMPLKEWLLTCL